jgi:hypothetical protein
MRYKVGDKVKVRSDLRVGKSYGEHTFVHDMFKFMGKIVTIESVWEQGYRIEEDAYWWTDEMLEPVEEMSAEEAIKLSADLCSNTICDQCPVLKLRRKYGNDGCHNTKREHTEEYLEILKQWKADHEKKPIEMENVIYIVVLDEKRNVVYEEKTNGVVVTTDMKEEVLKKYCSEHDGKYYAIAERRCVVKE